MVNFALAGGSLEALGYVAVFAAAALVCFLSVGRARQLQDPDTRRGLIGLLVTSGLWAGAHVGYLLFPTIEVASAFHVVGLVVGFATLGPWLYFCSAYTGRHLHRDPRMQRLAVVVFGVVVLLKVTNPVHGLYFSAAVASSPFPHVAISYGVLHWLATGLAYALAAVGYFMLFELFLKTGHRTRALSALVAVTGLPVILNVVGSSTDLLVDIAYEPLGVAAFAVGVLYVFAERFEVIRLTGSVDTPAIYLNADGLIRDFNDPASDLFPGLADGHGEPVRSVLPELAERLERDDPILELETEGTRYYRLSTNRFTLGRTEIGEVIVLSDVTDVERHRRELERQNERLERFASVVSHDLRNPLNVAMGQIDLAHNGADDEHLATAAGALDRMEALIEDVLELARKGETIGETEAVALSSVVNRCRETVDLGESTLSLEADVRLEADADRTQALLENLIRNAIDHSEDSVTIRVGAREDGAGFFVADDGPGIPPDEREAVFESGFSTAESGTGLGLAIVAEIARAHGWAIAVGESESGGARFDVTGVEASLAEPE